MSFFTNKKIKQILGKAFLALVLVVVLGWVINVQKSYAQSTNTTSTQQNNAPVFNTNGLCTQNCQNVVDMTTARANAPTHIGVDTEKSVLGTIAEPIFRFVGYLLQLIPAMVLSMSGYLFDKVIQFSILEMSTNIKGEGSLGSSIDQTWKTLRDIANMFFILVLLFTAFKAMFQLSAGNVGRTILNIVIVALLINFSLFFTKVVIDASNVVAIGFYNSIVSTNRPAAQATEGTQEVTQGSISSGYMRLLGLQSWFDPAIITKSKLDAQQLMVTGVMSAIFMLVVAVVMFIASAMLLARWLLLIVLMILSPVAFIAIIIPGMSSNFEKWKNAVIDQSFFAPLYFAMTWVSFKIAVGYQQASGGVIRGGQNWSDVGIAVPSDGMMTLILNYFIVIGFSIIALVVSKQMASKTPYFTTLTGTIGAGVAGTSAWAGRTFMGSAGNSLANKMQSAKASNNFATRNAARFLSYTGEKAAKSSFDIRNAAIPTSVVGDAIRGTVGRTKAGKFFGLNDVNIQSIDVGNKIGGGLVGTADKKGYAERKAESNKRIGEREAKEKAQIKLTRATNSIVAGAKAPTGTTGPVIDEMERSLANLSDKETESLVVNNGDLLENPAFANKVSVKQLEAIIKSDQLSDEQKSAFKKARFVELENINNAAGLAAIARRSTGAALTPAEVAAAKKVEDARKKVKNLHDSELEMIDPKYLDPGRPEGVEFIAQLKGNQVEAINKNNKFTTSTKDKIKEERIKPLINAIISGRSVDAQNLVRKADVKTKVGYMRPVGIPPITIATHPDILPVYTPKMLQRMAAHDDMSDDDIHNLRLAILGGTAMGTGAPGVQPATIAWLLDVNKGVTDFP